MLFQKQPLSHHFIELRKRLIFSVLVFLGFCALSYVYLDSILSFLMKPLAFLFDPSSGRRFIYTGLTEAFFTYLKTSLYAGFLLSAPFWLFQTWRFIQPGLYENEKKVYRSFFIASPFLFYLGCALAYYLVCPMAFQFFLSFESSKTIIPLYFEARISEYIQLMMQLMVVFGLGFQLPIILVLCVFFGILSPENLKKHRRHAFLIITIIAAVITPPDLISPISLIIPTYALYEMALIWLKYLPLSNDDFLKI